MTVVFTAGFVAVTMLLGLGIALLLDVKLPGLRHVRAFFVIPLVVPPVATAFIWFTFFQPDTGLFNRLLISVGLPQSCRSSPTDALIAVIAFGAWQYFGEFVLIYLAALKALPRDVLEAASIDGAGAWQRLRYVRWPLLRHQTALLMVSRPWTGGQTFTQIFILTDGGPQGATQTALYYVYQEAFGLGGPSTGLADAMSVILSPYPWLSRSLRSPSSAGPLGRQGDQDAAAGQDRRLLPRHGVGAARGVPAAVDGGGRAEDAEPDHRPERLPAAPPPAVVQYPDGVEHGTVRTILF